VEAETGFSFRLHLSFVPNNKEVKVSDLGVRREPQADERGATAVEYGLMVAFIALAIITVVQAFGLVVADFFQQFMTGMGW
jgi:pilus assembly protein Flp/PilA